MEGVESVCVGVIAYSPAPVRSRTDPGDLVAVEVGDGRKGRTLLLKTHGVVGVEKNGLGLSKPSGAF